MTTTHCPECGTQLVAVRTGLLCPNGHGGIYPRITKRERVLASMPVANRTSLVYDGCSLWQINGYAGLWMKGYGYGNMQAKVSDGIHWRICHFIRNEDAESKARQALEGK